MYFSCTAGSGLPWMSMPNHDCDVGAFAGSRIAVWAGSDASGRLGCIRPTYCYAIGGTAQLPLREFHRRAARLFRVCCGPDGPTSGRVRIDPAESGLHAHTTFRSGPTQADSELTCVSVIRSRGTGGDSFLCKRKHLNVRWPITGME